MAQKIFNLILVLVFIVLVVLFAYKRIFTPEIVTAPIEASSAKENDKVATQDTAKTLSKKEIEDIIKNYIINNPDVLVNSLENMHKRKLKKPHKKLMTI